jgi:hypothetical protein
MPSPIRILTAVPICDGHDSAINTINLEFIRHGIEVIYLGYHRSVGDIARHQRLRDNDAEGVRAHDMLTELRDDNRELTRFLRVAHELCDRHKDVATASLIENWIDEAERRTWFLSETTRGV